MPWQVEYLPLPQHTCLLGGVATANPAELKLFKISDVLALTVDCLGWSSLDSNPDVPDSGGEWRWQPASVSGATEVSDEPHRRALLLTREEETHTLSGQPAQELSL